MRPCPVCESPVSGWTCEVCGKELGAAPAASAPVAALEGLEPTELPGLPTLGIAIDSAQDLEPTLQPAAPEVPGERVPGWEAGDATGGIDVPAGGLLDVDLGRELAVAAPTRVPASITCRYCRHVQVTGLFCDRCGYRPPRAPAPSEAAAATPVERLACPRCFERNPADRARCGACGALLRTED